MIPVYKPYLHGNEKKYVKDCMDSEWISSNGNYVAKFENLFATKTNSKHAIAVCNGTAAVHSMLLALGIQQGDEVIVPALTYVASVNPIVYCGATPIFVDVTKTDWTLSIEQVYKKITHRTKAILPVHLYGFPCNMKALDNIHKETGIHIIEDGAEAVGAYCGKDPIGTSSSLSAYSFFGNKTITTGEGGMVTTNSDDYASKVRKLVGQGVVKPYYHDIIGYNYRMTNICAAIGLGQLEQLDEILYKKRLLAKWYRDRLPLPCQMGTIGTPSYWMNVVLVPDRDKIIRLLRQVGVDTRPTFIPIPLLPMYNDNMEYPNATEVGLNGICLPSYPDLREEQVSDICEKVKWAIDWSTP
jgi:perosamine synthetase